MEIKADQTKKVQDYIDNLVEHSTATSYEWNPSSKKEGFKPAWNYVDGCMIKAFIAMYEATGDEHYIKFADDFIDSYVSEDGNMIRYDQGSEKLDDINMSKVLFPLYRYTEKEKYKKALDLTYSQLSHQPRTTSGNFWHKRVYTNQIWLDGLYMALPFYLEYEKEFNGYKNYRDVFLQFVNADKLMKDEKTGLLYHGYDEKHLMFWCDKETGKSRNFWSRAMGWYVMALVDTIELMDERFFFELETLRGMLREILDALLVFQDKKSKLFYQVTDMGDRAGNYLETSGSAAIAYALLKGANRHYLPTYYYDYGKEIFDALVSEKLVEKEGKTVLADVCLVSGLGSASGNADDHRRDGTYEYYISEPRVDNDGKGVAPFIYSYAEILRHEKA